MISGWGNTKANQIEPTNDLMEATTYTMTNKACLDLLYEIFDVERDDDDDGMPDTLICAYNANKAR